MNGFTLRRSVPILVYEDVAEAHRFLSDVFGLAAGQVNRDADGLIVHAEVGIGHDLIWLHRERSEFGLRSPVRVGADTAGVSVMIDNVDVHFAHVAGHGATVVYPPENTPYGVREYGVRDVEYRLWSFMTPLS